MYLFFCELSCIVFMIIVSKLCEIIDNRIIACVGYILLGISTFMFTKLKNKPVICYGLRTDFKTNGFPGSTRLLEIAHTIEEMKTICSCGKKAMFNARRVNGKFSFAGEQVAIDGKDEVTYQSLCPKCYYHKLEQYEKIKNSLKK